MYNPAVKFPALDPGKMLATDDAVDWSIPIDDTAFHFHPEYLSLYGTPQWNAMSEKERFAYSRHEAVAFYRTGTWFENILIHGLMHHLYDLPANDPLHRFLYLEASEECRHCAMFGEFARHAGTPPYLPSRRVLFMGKILKHTGSKIVYHLAILGGEEIADAYDRATSRGENIHPVSKQMAKLHVIDETRHMAFVKTYLAELWPALGPVAKAYARWYMPITLFTMVDAMVNRQVYRTLGIKDGYSAAWRNPHRRERIRQALAGYTGFLTRLGVITPMTRPVWRALGLLA